jgi:hypothetical protein
VVSVFPTCAYLLALVKGMHIHGYAIRIGFESNKVGSWNEIIVGYSPIGLPCESLTFFNKLQAFLGIKPTSINVVSVLLACVELLALEQDNQINSYVIKNRFECDVIVEMECNHCWLGYNAFEYDVSMDIPFIYMYTKHGHVNISHNLFKRVCKQDVGHGMQSLLKQDVGRCWVPKKSRHSSTICNS